MPKSYGEDDAGHGAAVLTPLAGHKIADLIFRQSETNDLGEYRIYDIAPGHYVISATPGGHRFQTVSTLHNDDTDQNYTTTLTRPHPDRHGSPLFECLSLVTGHGSRLTEFLIANPRLKFSATHRRSSPVKISTRERRAISRFNSSTRMFPVRAHYSSPDCPERAHGQRRATRHCPSATHHRFSNRYIRNFKISTTPALPTLTQFLIGTKSRSRQIAPFVRCLRFELYRCTRKQAFSIHGIIGFLCSA
jgi:hypothetical protein